MLKVSNKMRSLVIRDISALSVSTATAMSLVCAYTMIDSLVVDYSVSANEVQLFDVTTKVIFALCASAIYAVAIACICAPIWYLLKMLRLDNAFLAAVLGCISTIGLWLAANVDGGAQFFDTLAIGFPYSLCGAAAGLVTWFFSARRSEPKLAS